MEVTKEQLAVFSVAKARDQKRPYLTQIKVEKSGRASATNGHMVAVVERELTERPKKAFEALIPQAIARTVIDQAKRDDVGTVELINEQDGPTFYVKPRDDGGEGTAVRYHPLKEGLPDLEEGLASVLATKPRARVAIGSQFLATIASLRTKIGDKGPVRIEVRGEADPIVCKWRDDKGHRVRVILMPTVLDSWEWSDEAPGAEDTAGGKQLRMLDGDDDFEDEDGPGEQDEAEIDPTLFDGIDDPEEAATDDDGPDDAQDNVRALPRAKGRKGGGRGKRKR